MRGGVTINDLMLIYSHDDIEILRKIIEENIKNTTATGIALV
jgi:hypothetical protein